MQGQIPAVAKQLSDLVLLASCAYLAAPEPKPKVIILPAVEVQERSRKGNLTPEVQEFMQLPPLIQRQVLDYARNWILANFERVD